MKRAAVACCILSIAALSNAAVFERYLSPDRPDDRAILAYYELANTGKASSRDLAELGVLLLDKGFPDDAEHYLREAVKADKHNFEAAYRLGLVLQRMGRDKDAIRYYRSVVKQRPGHAYARFMLALAEERSGRPGAAIEDYAKTYRFMPDLADPVKNPLVIDSELQTQAMLLHYKQAKLAATLKVDAIDPAAVKHMMEAKGPSAAAPAPATPTQAQPAPALAPAPGAAKPPAAVAAPAGAGKQPGAAPVPGASGKPPVGLSVRPTPAPGATATRPPKKVRPPVGTPEPH